MPLIALNIPPGAFRNGTEYQAKGRWRDVNLVRWREGAMMPVGGWDAYTFADGQAHSGLVHTVRAAVAWLDNSGNPWLLFASGNYIHVMDDDGTVTDITPGGYTAGSSVNRFSWQWTTFGQIPVGCANTDGRLWEWDLNVANNLTAISGAPTSCTGIVVTDERFIFALGDGGDSRSIRWCDRDNRTTWTPATTNQAGGWDLKTEGEIRFGIQMRGETLIVTSKDAWVARYVGYPNVYEFNRVGQCTAVGGMCGVRVDDRAYWMGDRCFYVYAGGAIQTLPCEVSDYIFADINDDGIVAAPYKGKTTAWHNSEFGEVWWHYQSVAQTSTTSPTNYGDCDKYVAYNYVEGHWHYGAAPFSCVVDKVPFDRPLGFNPRFNGIGTLPVLHTFDSDPGYTLGSNWRIAGGVLDQSAPTASSATWTIPSSLSVGLEYEIWLTISNRTAGTLTITLGGDSVTCAANGTFHYIVTAASGSNLVFTGDGTWDGDVGIVYVLRPQVMELETGYVHESGTTPAPYAETGPLEIGDGERRVHVMRVLPDEQDAGELSITFQHREYPTSTETTQTTVTAANPTDVRFSGRQFTMKVAPGSNVDWRSGVHRLEIMPGGKR